MSQNVCSFCGNYHDSVTSVCPVSQQQKGETMPKFESRSNMKRKAVLRGETMPKGEGQSLRFGGWTHSLEELDAICDVAISSPQNPDGSMQTNHVMNPQFYADVKRLVVAVRRFYEMDYREALSGQPTASAERRLREVLHKAIGDCCFGRVGPPISWLRNPEDVEQHILEALQSVPSSPLIIVSDAGRPSLESTETIVRILDGDLPPMAANHCDAITTALEAHDKRVILAALKKLRELEAKWRNPDWARAHMNDDRPSEFICADELQAVLAELTKIAGN